MDTSGGCYIQTTGISLRQGQILRGQMQFIVIRYKYSLNAVQTPDQFHPFFQSQSIACSAQGVSVHRTVGDDSDLIQIVLNR